jgi:hypothetical protein
MSRTEGPRMLCEDFQCRVDGIAGATGEGR